MRGLGLKEFWQLTRCKCPVSCSWINRGRILAIDVGSSNVGFAISDDYQSEAIPLTTTVRLFPYGPLHENGERWLRSTFEKNQINGIVVGKPARESTFSEEFMQILNDFHRIRIENVLYWDESYSTVIANDLHMLQMYGKKRKRMFGKVQHEKRTEVSGIDSLAATVILNEYLGAIQHNFYQG